MAIGIYTIEEMKIELRENGKFMKVPEDGCIYDLIKMEEVTTPDPSLNYIFNDGWNIIIGLDPSWPIVIHPKWNMIEIPHLNVLMEDDGHCWDPSFKKYLESKPKDVDDDWLDGLYIPSIKIWEWIKGTPLSVYKD